MQKKLRAVSRILDVLENALDQLDCSIGAMLTNVLCGCLMNKKMEGAPHDVMLVLDATTGQNAIEQAKQFTAATEVSSLALTKLDGTAKGGVAIGISDQFKIPIRYIGIGEGIEQLQVFNKRAFVDSFFKKAEQ